MKRKDKTYKNHYTIVLLLLFIAFLIILYQGIRINKMEERISIVSQRVTEIESKIKADLVQFISEQSNILYVLDTIDMIKTMDSESIIHLEVNL